MIEHTRKKVALAAGLSYIENVKAGQHIELIEEHGAFHMDVGFLVEDLAEQLKHP